MNAIKVDGVTKIYRLYHSPRERLKELFSRRGKKHHHEFHALRDISFTVETGETVGIIGQNGSGKSTLLKIITGVIQPTGGAVKVNGRVSSLLELGAGFNPEFTGRDNVFMNGALMGFSQKEMERKFAEIAAFADIGEFVDQPVRTYSSGMYTRLAFSAAINVDPDILIIDEILSVGDENFQSKCRQKIQELRRSGKTILLVSHDMFTVENLCGKVCLLDHGRCLMEGKPVDVIPAYKNIMQSKPVAGQGGSGPLTHVVVEASGAQREFKRWGTKDVEITDVYFINNERDPVSEVILEPNGKLSVRIEYTAHKRIVRPVFGIAIHRDDGIDVNRSNTRMSRLDIPYIEGKGAIEYAVDRLPLLPGKFHFTASVSDYDVFIPYDLWYKCLSFSVSQTESVEERVGIVHLDSQWNFLRS
ncbi:MAG: ABC transporter ATP-binding protein [Nitrospirae bacterium]|nr:ABC transporter ATP-binding protein [Nitrospirota bacterium]